jgi:hypothetical protein
VKISPTQSDFLNWSRLGYSFVRDVFVHDDTPVDFGGKKPAGAFLVTEGWMRFVIETRSGANISRIVQQIGIGVVVERVERSEAKHAGLNMQDELAWINSFIDKGA